MPNDPRVSVLLMERDIARAQLRMIEGDLEALRPKPAPHPTKVSTRLTHFMREVGKDIRSLRTAFVHLGTKTDKRFNLTEEVTGRLSGEIHGLKRRLHEVEVQKGEFNGSQMGMLSDTILKVGELERDLTDLGRNTAGVPTTDRLDRIAALHNGTLTGLLERIEGFESKLAALNPTALGEMIADRIIAHTQGEPTKVPDLDLRAPRPTRDAIDAG